MSNETYNGWTNWDTWNANLWLANDEITYHELRSVLPECSTGRDFQGFCEEALDTLGNPDDVRYDLVNWSEIHEAFSEE